MHSEYCNTLVLRARLILNYKIFSLGIGIVIEFSKLRYWYWYLYWFSKSGVLVLKSVSISEIWNIDIDIGIETWFFRIKYWYWLIRAGIAHLCSKWLELVLYFLVLVESGYFLDSGFYQLGWSSCTQVHHDYNFYKSGCVLAYLHTQIRLS